MLDFTSILRKPDSNRCATEKNLFRFEEKITSQDAVKFDYDVKNNCAGVTVYPNQDGIMYIKLRFRGDFSGVDSVYGDYYARSSFIHPLEWKGVVPERRMPWFCIVKKGDKYACYGVKTGANCFASWCVDPKGLTLFLDLTNGTGGVKLTEPLLACEVVEYISSGETAYDVAEEFAKIMCNNPVMPKTPIFGVNNWYWAYGDISFESVIKETDYLMEMTKGCKNKPYMIIDDGWQTHRLPVRGAYIGGEWEANDKFGDMKKMADEIHARGAKAGIWFRPLLTRLKVDEDMILTEGFGGTVLDPSNPKVIEMIKADAKKLAGWGYDLIKHDFTQIDMFGSWQDSPVIDNNPNAYTKKREFFDKTKTNATIIKNIYKAVQEGAGEVDVIGCNVFGHLSAGIHSVYRVGGDTSGHTFEITRSDGINSMMRLPTNKAFYLVDPDCAAFTKMVDAELNLEFLEMCAKTSVTTLASVTPGILTDAQMKRINEIYRLIDKGGENMKIKDYDKTTCPDTFISLDGKTVVEYDWYKGYDGIRINYEWVEEE